MKLQLDDLVTRHMRTGFVRLREDQTIAEALESVRANPPSERIIYFYVLADDGKLLGVVPTRYLLLNALDRRLADIMIAPVIAIPQHATVLDACEFFTLHRLLAFPIVDAEQRMLGVVDVELYTDELSDLERSERNDDLFQLIGVHLTEAKQGSPWAAFGTRFPWLLCNVAGGILAAVISGLFEAELRQVVQLALFVPVVLALAESVSVQSVSLALQVMQGRRPTWKSLGVALYREWFTGGMLGFAAGALVALAALAWIQNTWLTLCLLLSISISVSFAAALGLALPMLFRIFQRDPRVAAGPIVLATVDMFTLTIYFTLARYMVAA